MPNRQTARQAGESLLPEERLRRRADFLRCYEQGRRCRGELATIYIAEREPTATHPRLGITVTRKVGGSVVRHKIKRRIREIYRRWSKRDRLAPYDIVVQARPAARKVDFQTLEAEIQRLLKPLLQ